VSRLLSEAVLAGLSAACLLFAALLYALQRDSFGLPSEWDLQFYALIAVSAAVTILPAFMKGSAGKKAALGFRALCFFMACYPLPTSSGLQLVLGMPLAMTIVAYFPRPDYFAIGAAFIGVVLALQRPALVWGRSTAGAAPAQFLFLGFGLVFAFTLGVALKEIGEARRRALAEARRLDLAIDRIAEVNAGFQSALAKAEEDSILKERNRITRDIHDIVGYAFTNQQMMVEAALMLAGKEGGRLSELLTMARDGLADGLRETRKTLYELRRMDEPRSPDIGVFLKVAGNFESVTGVRVTIDFGNARGELEQGAWMFVYRLIQESMINAFRHGKAKNIAISFREDQRDFHVLVRDDGTGAPEVAEGIGIRGMRERLAVLGGELAAGNTVDGFMVRASVPKRGKGEGA
jgi:signal transduction histidine kinase